MSRSVGPRTADPCPRCFVEAVRPGVPVTVEGCDVVGYHCEQCTHAWNRPVESDLGVHDIVRADLPDVTLYGSVRQVEGDRVQVLVSDSRRLLWIERWRLIAY
ncbi:hypothetical protein [Streptomyces galbus]|uniref:Uncharacterized protein n=1 Tax=Streptomyces galbus TaxID=33898 RepID=A0A4U5W6I1_STRGB|nr:hypothetical protein [Streptomyces galbus]TKS97028.1 hypothetical protein E4U92_34030 [Streptomyces galbus]